MPTNIKLIGEESNAKINEAFRKKMDSGTAALGIIAPYLPAKVTPSKRIPAQIGLQEELNVDEGINEFKKRGI